MTNKVEGLLAKVGVTVPLEVLTVKVPKGLRDRVTDACRSGGIDRGDFIAASVEDAVARLEDVLNSTDDDEPVKADGVADG